MVDKRARAILLSTYWSSSGWKPTPSTNVDDVAYATQAGYMFPVGHVAHGDLAPRIHAARQRLTLAKVRDAFLASLTARRLDARSALGSFAIALHYPIHAFSGPNANGDFCCHVCGAYATSEVDWSILNFERHKWGGVRRLDPSYIAFDLEQFVNVSSLMPCSDDLTMFEAIIDTLRHVPQDATCTDAEHALRPVIPSNRAERQVLLEILSCCGILTAPDHPGFLQTFIPHEERKAPPRRTDWTYPAYWWRGRHGVNNSALSFYFGRGPS